MSTELAASYFDAERIEEHPNSVYLSEEGAYQLLDWLDVLEANGYDIDSPNNIYGSAGFLIANGHSQVDLMTTAIMLGYASVKLDEIDDAA